MSSKTLYAEGGFIVYPCIVWTENVDIFQMSEMSNPVPDEIKSHLDLIYNKMLPDDEEESDILEEEEEGGWIYSTSGDKIENITKLDAMPYGCCCVIQPLEDNAAAVDICDVTRVIEEYNVAKRARGEL